MASEPRRCRKEADLGMSQDHSLLGSPNNQKKNQCSCVGVCPEQDAEQRGFQAFFAGFLSIPNSQPCARGTFRAISRYLCSLVWQTPKRTDLPCFHGADAPCVSSKAVLFGLYQMYHDVQPICREKWRRETWEPSYNTPAWQKASYSRGVVSGQECKM